MNKSNNEMMPLQADNKGEIVLYHPERSLRLEVLVEGETVWLTQAQMVTLFDRERTVITKHINNIFHEGELDEESNVHYLHIPNSDKPVKMYNLDVIISVGYRVKSHRGIAFRRWATKTLRDYILKGYAMNQRFERIEHRVAETEKKIDFFIKTSAPPIQGVFFEGQIFDAYAFVSDLIRSAKESILLADNYVDETVLLLLSKRSPGVAVDIYTKQLSSQLRLDLDKYNSQYGAVNVYESNCFHDRFLIIDHLVYHVGSSIKDLGKKLFAFSKMEIKDTELIMGLGVFEECALRARLSVAEQQRSDGLEKHSLDDAEIMLRDTINGSIKGKK